MLEIVEITRYCCTALRGGSKKQERFTCLGAGGPGGVSGEEGEPETTASWSVS
jgi:hypothetical protein